MSNHAYRHLLPRLRDSGEILTAHHRGREMTDILVDLGSRRGEALPADLNHATGGASNTCSRCNSSRSLACPNCSHGQDDGQRYPSAVVTAVALESARAYRVTQ